MLAMVAATVFVIIRHSWRFGQKFNICSYEVARCSFSYEVQRLGQISFIGPEDEGLGEGNVKSRQPLFASNKG